MYKKIICIKDFSTTYCDFIKDHTYTLKDNVYSKFDSTLLDCPLLITSENKNTYAFHTHSPFYKHIFPEHFIDIKDMRKLKLKKVYESNL